MLLEYLMQCLQMNAVSAAAPAFILAFHRYPPILFPGSPVTFDDVRCLQARHKPLVIVHHVVEQIKLAAFRRRFPPFQNRVLYSRAREKPSRTMERPS